MSGKLTISDSDKETVSLLLHRIKGLASLFDVLPHGLWRVCESFVDDTARLESLRRFAHVHACIAEELLGLLRPQLSGTETMFVDTWGPQMYYLLARHAEQAYMGGCSEAREAGKQGRALKMGVDQDMNTAGIPPDRQALLHDLVGLAATRRILPPRRVSDLEYYLRQFRSQVEVQCELAKTLRARGVTIIILAEMVVCARALSS